MGVDDVFSMTWRRASVVGFLAVLVALSLLASAGCAGNTESQVHAALRAGTLGNGRTMDSVVKAVTVDGNAVTIALNQTPTEFGAIGHPGGVAAENIGIQENCRAIEKAVLDKIPQVMAVRVVIGNAILDTVVRAPAAGSTTTK
jgi:hypothetical protein